MFGFFRKKKHLIKSNNHEVQKGTIYTLLQFRNTGYLNKNGIPFLGTLQIKYKNNIHFKIDEHVLKTFIDKVAKEKIHKSHETITNAVYIGKIYGYIQSSVKDSGYCFVSEMFKHLKLTIGFIENSKPDYFELQYDANDLFHLVPEDILDNEIFKTINHIPELNFNYLKSTIKTLKFHTNIIKPSKSNRKTLIVHQKNDGGVVFVNDIMKYILSVNRFDNWTIHHIFEDFSKKLKSNDNELVVVLKEDLSVVFTKIELCYNKETCFIEEFLADSNIKNLIYQTY